MFGQSTRLISISYHALCLDILILMNQIWMRNGICVEFILEERGSRVNYSKKSQGSSFNVCVYSMYVSRVCICRHICSDCVRLCSLHACRSIWVILRLGSSSRRLKIDTLMTTPERTCCQPRGDKITTEFNLYTLKYTVDCLKSYSYNITKTHRTV